MTRHVYPTEWDDTKESHVNGRHWLTAELEASMNRKRRPGYGHLLLFTAALLSVVLIFVFGIAGAAFLIQQGLEAAAQ